MQNLSISSHIDSVYSYLFGGKRLQLEIVKFYIANSISFLKYCIYVK